MKYAPHQVQEFIDAVTDSRKPLFMLLHDRIMELYPQATKRIAYQVLEFRIPTGKLFIGYHKNGVSLYVGHLQQLEEFRAKHPNLKTSVGTVQFRMGTDVPWDDVSKLIRSALERKEKP